MMTVGFTYSYSDLVVNDVAFPFASTYLYVPVAGDVVYQGRDGTPQFMQGLGVGYHPISTRMVLANGTVNGTPRVTTATGMMYCSDVQY